MKIVNLDYNQFKAITISKNLLGQYKENTNDYELFAIEAGISWETRLRKGTADTIDFETNYKAGYNQPLEQRDAAGVLQTTSLNYSSQTSKTGKLFKINSGIINTGLGGADFPVVLIKNPAGNKSLNFSELFLSSLLVDVDILFKIYHNATITENGTALPVHALNLGSSASSDVTAYALPTISDLGTEVDVYTVTGLTFNQSFHGSLILPPAHNLLVTARADLLNRPVNVQVEWTE